MIIVHLIWIFDFGGAESLVLNILNEQCQTSNEIHLIVINSRYNESLLNSIDKKVNVHLINRQSGSLSLLPFLKLNSLLNRIKPDIIHCHIENLIKVIFYKKAKRFLTVHDVCMPAENFRKYDRLFSISKAVMCDISERTGLQSTLIYNGVTVESIIKKTDFTFDTFKIVQISRLIHNKKGQDILIKALSIIINDFGFKNISLHFIGSGDSLEFLKKRIKEEKIDEYTKFLNDKDPDYIYRNLCNYDLLIQPSRFEGFGLTIIEAMAAKVPVLVSKVDGPSEILKNGQYGYIFESENPESCAAEIKKIIEIYGSLNFMNNIEGSYNYVLENFNVKRTAQQYLNEYSC